MKLARPRPTPTADRTTLATVRLRCLKGYLAMVLRESEESFLDADDQALSPFAGKAGRPIGALAQAIEEELS